jgi:hypothetical protein
MAWIPPPHWDETQAQLKKSGNVTLNSSGNGVITFDPDTARQRWVVTSCVVGTNQAATATTVPQVTIALNSTALSTMSQGNQRGSTWSGNQDQWDGELEVSSGDFMSVIFAPPTGQSGTPLSGVICTAVITGVKYNRRR